MNDIESIRFELARYREERAAAEKQGNSGRVATINRMIATREKTLNELVRRRNERLRPWRAFAQQPKRAD